MHHYFILIKSTNQTTRLQSRQTEQITIHTRNAHGLYDVCYIQDLSITFHVSLFGDHGQTYFKKKLVTTGLFLKFCTLQCDSNVYIYINSYPPSCPHHQVKISIAVYGGADPGVITQELLPQYLQKITDALSPY